MKHSAFPRLLTALISGLVLIGATAFLSGCSDNAHAQATAAPVSQTAYARGRVDIEGGLIRLASSNDGLIQSVHVEEGDRVQAGQVLAVIDDRQARLALAISAASLAEAKAAAQTLHVRLAAATREAERIQPLADAQATPRREADQARDLVEQLQAELASAQAAVVTAEARLKADEYQVDQRSIRAPLAGRIVKRTVRPGDGVSTLNVTPLFVFAPDMSRIVRADLDERFVDRVKVGQTAEVVIDNDGTRTLSARILRVGDVFGVKTPTGEPGERLDLRVVECVLSIDDQTVRLGQRVLVKIIP
ncbi:MAG: HlyD family efflux transporter periplasmic adaptor subunit [Opitutus sp.]|nr:HlyD family efflux transporter periplasmic adaptor subunit [Opitutus sp.]MCS6248466.1 HlyD family efflux transporter periplasmic adaptor subunit [Opitutus sp.]MCS6274448.1 HlyD family efflux transporter periplasmic adaptor subunit [Opitutus sp.]MCS6277596.1 HlyD family efflux transporter periplasmic adaptor subunit [Opitutus sp.]MCS6300714.1 HlyD family efflux transporter periplasmic adaptor subunit [Opitutus sp.]